MAKEAKTPEVVEQPASEPAVVEQVAAEVNLGWWLCKISDAQGRELYVFAKDAGEAVEKFKLGCAIRSTIHQITVHSVPDYEPTEDDLALEKRLSAAN